MKIRSRKKIIIGSGTGFILLLLAGLWLLPGARLRVVKAETWVRGLVSPAGALPPAAVDKQEGEALWLPDLLIVESQATDEESFFAQEPVKSILPQSVTLPAPVFIPARDYQDWNNCGPATLALALRYWGWQGDQFDISRLVKPEAMDKNVSAEELAWFVGHETTAVQAEIRMGGDLNRLKQLLSSGFPVMIEKTFRMEKAAWPGDDFWAGHYLLLTGYDDATLTFTAQDSYYGPNQTLSYPELEEDWRSFNHLYLVVFPKSKLAQAQAALAADWLADENLERARKSLQESINMKKDDAFSWFNLGTTFVSLGDYPQAAEAFAAARRLGLPQRMLRYQFGPFRAAYETGNLNDLALLTDYALKITPDSEEALLWKGRLLLREDKPGDAAVFFREARKSNPTSQEALAALALLSGFQ